MITSYIRRLSKQEDALLYMHWQGLTRFVIIGKLRFVKAVTINISLNAELAEFARADSEARAFDSMSEYMRELIRKRREEQIESDVEFLQKAIEKAPAGDPSDAEIMEIYAGIRKRRKR